MDPNLTLAEAEIQLSAESLRAARALAAESLYRNAISSLYYAAYHSAAALLCAHGIEATTHDGVQSMFSLHFVKPGAVDARAGKLLGQLYHARLTADYKGLIDLDVGDYQDMAAAAALVVTGCAGSLAAQFPDLDVSPLAAESGRLASV